MSLWHEIKQRRITQIVLAYLAGGWMVLAVVDQVVDREVLPGFVYEVALTLYVFGIAAALIIGWYHGEKGEQKAPAVEVVLLSILGLLGVGASGLIVRGALVEAEMADVIDTDDLRRVAVLYLEDMTSDGSLGAVSDGITEGIIGNLSSIRDLDVASRNAALRARELGDVGPDSIASVLDVGALVDGTVDQVGDELRVSIRLLEGTTGTPLFRKSYTWPASDLASVGTVLATEVTTALREQLGLEIRMREARSAAPNSASWLQVARAERYLKDAAAAVRAGDGHAVSEALAAAHSELESARESAPEWSGPLVLLSQVAYERYILASSVEELLATLDRSVEYANQALALNPDNAAALEWRGTARYRRWLLGVDGEQEREAMLEQARSDLERSTTLDQDRASAYSTLSHLYNQVDNWSRAVLAAREAYRQDAFLDVADGVLWRLYTASYDLEEYGEADRWCQEGYERFPNDFRFTQCRIFLMTMSQAEPDVERAWELHEELLPLLPERPEYFSSLSRTAIAAIIGRAGLPDSANAVFQRARLNRELDPQAELLSVEAAMRSVMGDVEGSLAALERYLVANPGHPPSPHWWWRAVESHPTFLELRTSH